MARLKWTFLHPYANYSHLGFLVDFLDDEDPRPVTEQLDDTYRHGGGWKELNKDGVSYILNPKTRTLRYTKHGGEWLKPIARTTLHGTTIIFYDYAILAAHTPGEQLRVTRVD